MYQKCYVKFDSKKLVGFFDIFSFGVWGAEEEERM